MASAFLAELPGFLQVAEILAESAELAHQLEGFGMLGPQHPLVDGQVLLVEGSGLVELSLAVECRSQDVHRPEGLMVLRSQHLAGGCENPGRENACFLDVSPGVHT